jgi:predicted nucleic acid-binding protein
MRKLLVDTNILLDLLGRRMPYFTEAAKLFNQAEDKQVNLYLSSLSIVNVHYVLRKYKTEHETRKIIRALKLLVGELPIDKRITDLALNSEFNDFEDAIQYYTALEAKLDIIITRNLIDYKKSTLPVMTAGEFINHSNDSSTRSR